MKDARAARRAKLTEGGKASSGPVLTRNTIAVIGFTAILSAAVFEIKENPSGALGSLYYNSILDKFFKEIYKLTLGRFSDIFEPAAEKLLPDWGNPQFYGNIPPDQPAPPLLVIDLEKTLIGSTYDSRHGWRHVKRPGVDKFIKQMANYFEVVIFSENDVGMVQEILMAVDPEGRCHKFGSSHAEVRGTTVLKRLDLMNRDLSRIILIDDNPDSFQLFPRNTLQVKPFTNVNDKSDNVLLELVPLLQAFVHEDIKDFRDAFDNLGTHDAEEAAVEYRMRVNQKKTEELQKRNKGLGSLIRGGSESELDDGSVRSSILSPKDIVGGAFAPETAAQPSTPSLASKIDPITGKPKTVEAQGPAQKKKGALFSYLDNVEKEKEEEERRKREKMNEIYHQRMLAKQQQQQQQ